MECGAGCTTSAFGSMFYDALGGTQGSSINTTNNASYSLVSNIQTSGNGYWTSPAQDRTFDFADGTESIFAGLNSVWAVRNGTPEDITLLNVTYSDGSVTSGPLVGGGLPTTVNATFALAGQLDFANLNIQLADILAASIVFGDILWTADDLTNAVDPETGLQRIFSLVTDATGAITDLTYLGIKDGPLAFDRGVIMNSDFSATVFGTDPDTGNDYEYFYASSSPSLQSTVVPVPAAVWLFGSALLSLVGVRRLN